MRTCSRLRQLFLCSLLAAAVLQAACAQTLARPGWVGSGFTSEPWWHNAVFYRIDPLTFQDSDGDGIGDLRGIAQRMDYLQSLGVDAVLLDLPASDDGFDDLIAAASQHHLRVLITLQAGDNTPQQADGNVLGLARLWLTRGAAGIFLRSTQSAEAAAPLLHQLRTLADTYPGGRILLAATGTTAESAAAPAAAVTAPSRVRPIILDDPTTHPSRSARISKDAATSAPAPAAHSGARDGARDGAQIVVYPIELTNATAATLRTALTGINNAPADSNLLLTERLDDASQLASADMAALEGRRRAFALVLLATRGAAALRYSQELGQLPPAADAASAPLMQWTTSNIAPRLKADAAPEKPKDPNDGYGVYHPYVPPVQRNFLPAPAMPAVQPGGAPPPVDPDSLPGFTTGKLPSLAPADVAARNVAHEDPDPNSLLNLYRRLIGLHHGNPTLHNGPETLLDYDALGAAVWVRQPPRGSSTSATIIAVCNLSAAPLHLSLDAELTRLHLHTGSLRNLLSTQSSQFSVQSTGSLTLPPYGVFLGELYH